MKLSSTTLALSLLSFNNVFYLSSGFKQQQQVAVPSSSSTPLDRRMRMLQRTESRNAASQRRTKQNGQKNGGGGNPGGGNPNLGVGGGGPGNSNNDKGDKSGQGNSKGYGGKRIVEQHSAHLDTNDAGITTDKIEYTYGEPIVVTFDLTNELVSDEVLSTLDVSTMSEWKIGLYMRMARPQDGALEPIVSVSPSFTENVDVGRMLLQQHEEQPQQQQQRGKLRGLQDVVTTVVPTTNGVTSTGATSVPPPEEEEEPDDVTDEEEPQGPPPTLNYVGTATFTTTDIETLNPNLYGNGFDIYLIDDHGRQVIGPATLYELKSPEMLAADEAKANEKAKEMNKNGLMKFNHAKVKHQYGKGGSAKGGAKGASPFGITSKSMGKGSGVDGGQIIGTTESLATYVLTTNAEYYTLGDEVIVTYDISQDVVDEERRLQRNKEEKNNGNNGGGNGSNGNGNGNNQEPDIVEPVVVETTTSSTTTTTGGDGDETSPPTTTTPPEPVIDMSAGDNDMAAPVEIDPDDLHLYSLGIYMRMVRYFSICVYILVYTWFV